MFQIKSVLLAPSLARLSLVAVRDYKHTPSSIPGRQAKVLNKLVGKTKEKRHKEWFDGNNGSHPAVIGSGKRPNKNAPRRTAVLNKLFMKSVTELLANSTIGERVVGLGIEISRVQVCQNYHGLNVFWFSTASNEKLLTVEDRLAEIAGPLRHQMSQMRLMGEVPRITFVKDTKLSLLNEVDVLLATADFGEDHIPNPYGQRIKSEFDSVCVNHRDGDDASDMVAMRNDVFGVDRNAILGRIERSLAKTKSAWEAFEAGTMNTGGSQSHVDPTTIGSLQLSSAKQKKCDIVLDEFLAQRKLERKLKYKRELDLRQLEELEENEYQEEYDNDVDDDYDEDDVLDDVSPHEAKD